VRAYYLKEAFQLFWDYQQPKRAGDHLEKWMRSAMRSRLEPFKKFVRMLRGHLDGILSWTRHRVSNGAVEGMNNKIKSISHRSFGFRTAENFIAAIYHCCAKLPLPVKRRISLRRTSSTASLRCLTMWNRSNRICACGACSFTSLA